MKRNITSEHFLRLPHWTVALMLVFVMATPCWAGMKVLSNNQLSNVYAEGFSQFTITSPDGGATYDATATFNIYTSSYITVDLLGMGYYDDTQLTSPTYTNYGTTNTYNTTGSTTYWDEYWTNVQIGGPARTPTTGFYNSGVGTPSQDFKTSGDFISANFSNINNAATRTLNSITLGATSATGNISANFQSFSGTIQGVLSNVHRIADLGTGTAGAHTITANGGPLSITLSLTNGYQINFGGTGAQAPTVQ